MRIHMNEPKIVVTPITGPDPSRVLLAGDRTRYNVQAYRWGQDIRIPICVATSFGGPDDPGDNGSTASGARTDREPYLACVALPMPRDKACRGTPLPQLPWGTLVEITLGSRVRVFPVKDHGPRNGLASEAFVDLSPPAVALLTGHPLDLSTPRWWSASVSVRIIGGARYLTAAGFVPSFPSGKE